MVTGLGIVSPLGIGVPKAWERLLNGDCGIRAITADDLPEVHFLMSCSKWWMVTHCWSM